MEKYYFPQLDYGDELFVKDHPEMKTLSKPMRMLFINEIIKQFIPFVSNGKWANQIITDFQPIKEEDIKEGKHLEILVIVKGKMHHIVIWREYSEFDGPQLNLTAKQKFYPFKEEPTIFKIKVRKMIRFAGPSASLLLKEFIKFAKKFDIKACIPEIIEKIKVSELEAIKLNAKYFDYYKTEKEDLLIKDLQQII